MIVGYARVSTQDQDPRLQIDALKTAGCEKIFSDKASGAKVDRPELTKCLNFLQKGDTLVLWKLDRLGRSLQHLVNTVLDLNGRGVNLVITTMAIDTRTASGKLVFGIMASIAEFERSLIKERVAAGIKAAKARGAKFGRPRVVTDEIIAQFKEQHALTGISQRAFAAQVGVSKSALHNNL